MTDRATTGSVALAYAHDVFARARVPMEPADFTVDWDDQPSRHTVYRGAPRLPLPEGMPAGAATLGDAVGGSTSPRRALSADDVATLLRCYGVVQRRLRIHWNGDDLARHHYPHTTWARPTASGGGMYPVELYWVAGPSGSLVPGVYHYATGHHELERLAAGDVSGRVRAALGDLPAAQDCDQFLLLTLRFWKNAFKYASFCYHVVTQDLGALLGSWEMVARGLGLALEPALWFDERVLDELLGHDPASESVHVVVPLRLEPARGTPVQSAGAPGRGDGRVVRRVPHERSRRVLTFDRVRAVHASTMVGAAPRPADGAGAAATVPAGDGAVDLPAPLDGPLRRDLVEVLLTRRSSFGALTAKPRCRLDELATVLASASALRAFPSDVRPAGGAAWTRLAVLANHVDGLAQGAYHYDAARHRLVPARLESMTRLLQRSYFLTNYNMEQVAAFVAVVGRPEAMVRAYGDRGYRMLNAEVGAVAQGVYCAATAASVGCGAVLGIDNLAIDEVLGLEGGDERTLLFLLLGKERKGEADLASELVDLPRTAVTAADATTKEPHA